MVRRTVVVASCIVVLAASPARATTSDECAQAAGKGQEARDGGRLIEARSIFVSCASPACPLVIRKDCAEWLDTVNARLPGIVIGARSPEGSDVVDVRVLVDGKPFQSRLDGRVLPVDPGEHVFRFEPRGGTPFEQRVLAREGETNRLLTVEVRREPTAAGATGETAARTEAAASVRWPTFLFGGVSVIGLGAFAVFASQAKSNLSDLRGSCGATRSCADSDVAGVRRDLLVANVALGVAVLALGAAVASYVFGQPKGVAR